MLITVYEKVIVPASPLLNGTLTEFNLEVQAMADQLEGQYHQTTKHI